MTLADPSQAGLILLVEDDAHLAAGVAENLRAEGYEVETLGDGARALEWFTAGGQCALVILDVMLPGADGFTVCSTLRARGVTTPVLFLTALGEAADRIKGLEAGGDDYLAKPFHLREFLLRVRAILRRWDWFRGSVATGGEVLEFAGNQVDFKSFHGRAWNGEAQELTEKEAMILKILAEKPGEIVSREDLLERVWGYDVFPSTRTVDNFILRLRKRFERDPANPRHFLTVWGVGYRFLMGDET